MRAYTSEAWVGKDGVSEIFFFLIFIWLCWLLVAALVIFHCDMWDLVPCPGMRPVSPASGLQILSHWATREVPAACKLDFHICF